jgi:site-specific recombinase XerD
MASKPQKPKFEELFFSKTNEFLKVFLLKQRSVSPATEKSYRCGLSLFYDYVTETCSNSPLLFRFTDCTYQYVLLFMEHMQRELGYAPRSVNSRISALKSYLEYVSDGDAGLTSIYLSVRKVPTVSAPIEIRPVLKQNELTTFLNAPRQTSIGKRDRFILILLFDSAIRVGEIVMITLGDIVEEGGSYSILIHGKGRKERCIILSEKTSKHMKAYLETFHRNNSFPDKPLFYTVTHGKLAAMSIRNIERIVSKYGKEARKTCPEMPENTYPHMLRRTRASTLYRDGVPLEQVSSLLGHSQLETTRSHYASPSMEQMREAVNKGIASEPETPKEWSGHEDEIKRRFGL